MTSFTKKLYRQDPAAAEAFHRQATFEHKATYGRVPTLLQFTPAAHGLVPAFGKRLPNGVKACQKPCGHPACTKGCTLR